MEKHSKIVIINMKHGIIIFLNFRQIFFSNINLILQSNKMRIKLFFSINISILLPHERSFVFMKKKDANLLGLSIVLSHHMHRN